MKLKEFRSVGVTVTPFICGVKPDLDEIAKQTEMLAESRTDAILPCASTGDFVKMSPADRLAVLETVAKVNAGRKVLIAGACEASVAGVLETVEKAGEYGYDAAIVCPPYYYGLEQNAVLDFYRAVAEGAGDMPIIAYHVPFFTTGIEIPTYRELLKIPQITAIKDSSANLKRISHLCDIAKRERDDFRVYTGTDDCLFPALCAGCAGSMTALAASLPDEIADIYAAFDARDFDAAVSAQRKILPIIRLADSETFPMGYKLLAKAAGMDIKEPFTDKEKALCEKIAAELDTMRN